MTSFPHAIIATPGCIRFLQDWGEIFYEQHGGLFYPRSEPESYPNQDYNQSWIQDTWKQYQDFPGYKLLQGEVEPYYSLLDEETQNLYIYQNLLVDLGYTPLSFLATMELIADQSIFFAQQFTPSL